ncbi:MAG TPA: oxidoreductase [Candidatus Omnitrophica bacterium]|nr:oxidoreductase [Candidatus Omnitrophota bacterium]
MLFDPLKIREVTFKNRIAVSPMCQYSSEDGFATDWHLVHLGSRAVGGAGLVIAEASAVEAIGCISPQDLGIYKDEHIPNLKRITDFIKSQNSVAGIQIAHAGRKASCTRPWEGDAPIAPEKGGWVPVAPSAIPFNTGSTVPHALTADEIAQKINLFAQAAKRALAAGFELIEIHAAHGYLLNEFLSPLSNQRTDQYGGSFENRIRIVIETIRAVRKVWPEKLPLFLRISATDWMGSEGWDIEDSVALARIVKSEGVDLIDCSSGALVPNAKIPAGVGFQIPFAERIRKETGMMTGAVGFITSPEQAETIVRTGQADMVLIAREFLRDPYFATHAASKLHVKNYQGPVQYGRG